MAELEEYAVAHLDLEAQVMPAARWALSHLCWDGISDSTTQYWRLHQAEAAGHVHDLQHALATLEELERARAKAWREAAHDLRGSVTVVRGATSVLQEEMPEELRAQFFDILQRGVSSLHEMLNDLMGLMSLARLEAGQEQRIVAPFDAATLLSDFCTASLSVASERGLF
jgi:signal transduction histidine kinase